MKKIDISAINYNIEYDGYLWYSDSKSPIILMGERISLDTFSSLPFVIEGYLYSKSENGLSIKIKHIDGEYIVSSVELNSIPTDQLTQNDFVAIKNNEGLKTIRSVQYWEKISDPLCENMETLEPSWVAFNGFL